MNVKNYRDPSYFPVAAPDPQINVKTRSGSLAQQPWQLYQSADGRGNQTIRVYPGTVNGLLPSNIFEEFKISGSKTLYLIATVKAGPKGEITDCTLKTSGAQPKPTQANKNAPPTQFSFVVGALENGSVFSVFAGLASIPLEIKEVFRVQKNIKSFFEVPFDSYYSWVIK